MREILRAAIIALLMVQTGAAAASERPNARACIATNIADRNAKITFAPQAALDLDSTVLPDGGAVALRVQRRWDPDLVYFAFTGRLDRTQAASGMLVPPAVREVTVFQPRGGDGDTRTDLRLRLPRLSPIEFWPWHRIIVIGCRAENERIVFVAFEDAPIGAQGTAIVGTLILVSLVVLTIAAVRRRLSPGLSFARSLDPLVIAQDSLGYGSISRLQVLFFSLIVFALLSYIALRTGIVGKLSDDVLLLMGIMAAGTAGAAVAGNVGPAATRQEETSDSKGSEGLAPETRHFLAVTGLVPRDRIAHWRDLVVSRGEIDIFRVQAVVFSVFVGGTLLTSGFEQLANYEIPGTVLGLLGISQASYVGGKLVFKSPGKIQEVDEATIAVRAALARLASGDTSEDAEREAQFALAELRRELALLLEEAVPQARLDAILGDAKRGIIPRA